MCQDGIEIVSADNLCVEYYRAHKSGGRLLFTFTEHSNRQLSGFGYAGRFAIENGFDLVAIKSSLDDWYQGLPPDTFDRINEFLAGRPEQFNFRATYGSSMGGYAALLFAHKADVNIAFALSPQFDIGQPWDRRWATAAKHLGPIQTLTRDMVHPGCKYVIIYDPLDLDRLHIERFADVIPTNNLQCLKLPYAGHPVGYLLSSAMVLKELSLAVLSGSAIPDIRPKVRSRRHVSPEYNFNLALQCLKRSKLGWGSSMISKAIGLIPLHPEYRICAAQIAEANGSLVEAISQAAFAIALAPGHPHMVATLSRLLRKSGLYQQARHYLDIASALIPGDTFANERAALEDAMVTRRCDTSPSKT